MLGDITPQSQDFITVFIDGFPSDYWHLCLTERPAIPIPEKQFNKDDVLGRNGSFYTFYAFENMTLKLTFNYLEDVVDFKAFTQQMPHIRKWLHDGQKLEFSDRPDEYYVIQNAQFNGDVVNDIAEYGEFDVTLILKPFAQIYETEPLIIPIASDGKSATLRFYNNSIEDSLPTIEWESNGQVAITMNDNYSETFKTATNRFTGGTKVRTRFKVDGKTKTFQYLDVNGKWQLAGDFQALAGYPLAKSGANKIEIKNAYQSVNTSDRIYTASILRNMVR